MSGKGNTCTRKVVTLGRCMQFSLSSDGGLSYALGIILTNFLLWQHMVAMQLRCISNDSCFLSFFSSPLSLTSTHNFFSFSLQGWKRLAFFFIFDCSPFILNLLKKKILNNFFGKLSVNLMTWYFFFFLILALGYLTIFAF